MKTMIRSTLIERLSNEERRKNIEQLFRAETMNSLLCDRELLSDQFIAASKIRDRRNKTNYVEIFQNPTRNELHKVQNKEGIVRGVILRNGDFFIILPESPGLIHVDIVSVLIDNKILSDKAKLWLFFNNIIEEQFLAVKSISDINITTYKKGLSYDRKQLSQIPEAVFEEYKERFERKNPGRILKI